MVIVGQIKAGVVIVRAPAVRDGSGDLVWRISCQRFGEWKRRFGHARQSRRTVFGCERAASQAESLRATGLQQNCVCGVKKTCRKLIHFYRQACLTNRQ